MMEHEDLLFCDSALQGMFKRQNQKAEEIVDSLLPAQIRDTPTDLIVEHVTDRIQIKPLEIYEEGMHQKHEVIQFDDRPGNIHGLRVIIFLPFTGESELWHMQPIKHMPGMFPHGTISGDYLLMAFEQPDNEPPEAFVREKKENLDYIHKYINRQMDEIKGFNNDLTQSIRSLVEARKQRLVRHETIAEMIGVPLKHDPNAPNFRPVHVQRRIVRPLPPASTVASKPEFGITEKDYKDIISLIHHVGRTFEETPTTYSIHDEEELRDIILANLNIYYKGDASGETFRRSGKTDIRILTEDRAVFVAECKIWKGQKIIGEAIDQLLSYLTWRDCKTAIIIFNKKATGFTELLQKTLDALESHVRFKEMEKTADPGEWYCIFKSKEDDARLVYVHVFLFNLYVEDKNRRCSSPRKCCRNKA